MITRVKLMAREDRPGTQLAYQFHRPENKETVWVPRSLVEHVSYDKPDVEGWRIVWVDVAEWFAEKESL